MVIATANTISKCKKNREGVRNDEEMSSPLLVDKQNVMASLYQQSLVHGVGFEVLAGLQKGVVSFSPKQHNSNECWRCKYAVVVLNGF